VTDEVTQRGETMNQSDISGVYTPLTTPMLADESIDEATYARVVEFNIASGVRGLVIGGTTGEYYAMTMDERRRQLQFAAEVTTGRAQLVAGVNTGATRDAIALAKYAKSIGYDAVMLAAPPTSLPKQHELAAHCAAIGADGGLPIILYNYPARSGVEFGFDALDALADDPNVIAIKESSSDFSRFLAMQRRYDGRITIMCGSDDQAYDYFAWGVTSWLAGTANVFPAEHVATVQAAIDGNLPLSRARFAALLPWIQFMEEGSYNQKVKAGLRHRGYDVGGVRRPLQDLDAATEKELLALIDSSVASFAALD
jgi:4-hydroxy-tetrahydrodipicolinate synthase